MGFMILYILIYFVLWVFPHCRLRQLLESLMFAGLFLLLSVAGQLRQLRQLRHQTLQNGSSQLASHLVPSLPSSSAGLI